MASSTKLNSDSAYKLSLCAGIILVIASITISWQRYQKIETSITGALEQIILTRLDIISLGEQHSAVLAGLKLNHSSKDSASDSEYSDSQIEQLKQEAIALKAQLATTSNQLKELEFLRDQIKSDMALYIALTVIGLVLGILFILVGTFGWFYHVKIYEERRSQHREAA